jgi:outer membrane protein W
MKLRILLFALGIAAHAQAAHAQDLIAAPLVRADAWAGVGWHHARLAEEGEYDDWYHRSLSGSASAGWYWTDHLKTEIDAGTTSRGRIFVSEFAVVNGQPTNRYGYITHRTRTLGVTQQYQFLRNAWFHPYIGAGFDLVRETEEEEFQPIFVFDRTSGRSVVVEPPDDETSRRLFVRAAASVGFKAYVSRRAYFRSDARIGVRRQIEDVVVRFGFGVDF